MDISNFNLNDFGGKIGVGGEASCPSIFMIIFRQYSITFVVLTVKTEGAVKMLKVE